MTPRHHRFIPVLVLALVASGCALPPSALLREQPLALRSTIVAADGTPLATVFEENRTPVTYAQIPQVVQNAIVAVEDARFWSHGAVDTRALLRALLTNVSEGRAGQGGSTISQQLAKLMFTKPETKRTFKRKIVEARLAMTLEKKYTKQEILTMYLNRAYFGARAYGIAAAAETYFGKPLGKVSLPEAALLAGMVKAPTSLDPFSNPKAATQRRAYVLQRMVAEKMITPSQGSAASAQPLKLKKRSGLRALRFPYFVQYIEQQFLRDKTFGKTEEERAAKLYRGGLTIRTTINPKWQKWAEEAVAKTLYAPGDPEASLVAVDPRTGQVKAMVGGRNFYADQFNIAAQGRRQPGSAFKPFVLGAALEKGISPESRYASSPTTLRYYGTKWKVNNYDGVGHGIVTLRTGMEESINAVYARLVIDVGPESVVDFAGRAGITSKLDAFPSIALGALTYGVSPLEMASAYGTFAANGRKMPSHGIARVIDSKRKTIFDDRKLKGEQAIDPIVAYTLTDVLRDVACCGTARRAQFGRPMGAKTGTTEERRDVWLVGFTPDLSVAVWVGHRKPRPMRTLHGQQVFGGTFGARIWKYFMERALEGSPERSFIRPDGSLPLRVRSNTKGSCKGTEAGLQEGDTPEICPTATASPSPTPVPSVQPLPPPPPKPKPKPKPSPPPPPPPRPSPEPEPEPTPEPTPEPEPSPEPEPKPEPSP